MRDTVNLEQITLSAKWRAIVMFGRASAVSGMKAGEYYQVTIDPNMCSPSGEYIRFGHYKGDEITGWQRVDAMTICERLSESTEAPHELEGYSVDVDASVLMWAVA